MKVKKGFSFIALIAVMLLAVFWYWLERESDLPLSSAKNIDTDPISRSSSARPVSVPKGLTPKVVQPDAPEITLEDLAAVLARRGKPFRDVVIGFSSPEQAAAFAAEAPLNGIEVVDESEALASLRLRLRDPFKAREMLKEWKDEVELEWSRTVRAPPLPRPEYLDGEKGFGGEAADWMDVPDKRDQWGRGVTVAVLDSGIDAEHPSFRDTKLTSIDLVGGSHGSDGVYLGHGNAIASLIAGTSEGEEGLAPGAEILSIRVLDGEGNGDSFTVSRGIVEAADRGAKVINLSLGSDTGSHVLENAIKYARQKGAVIVAAVGNDGIRGISFPARYEGVVGVTSVDAKGRQSAFANYGEGVDIAAPGIGVHAAWSNDEVVSFSGTSSSTAFVSGAIAAEISRNPGMNSDQVTDMLYRFANEAEKPGEDLWTGHGILNVGRVENREVPGIRDVAVVGYYFDPEELKGGTTPFLVNVQYQGTEWLAGVSLKVEYNGVNRNFLIGSLDPGQVRSEKLFLDAASAADPDGVSIVSLVSIPGGRDTKPENDKRSSRITLPPPPQP